MRPLLPPGLDGTRTIGGRWLRLLAAGIGLPAVGLPTPGLMMLALGLMAVPDTSAHAQGAGPVCRAPSVVQEMARQIRARNHYSRLDARLINEQPTMIPNLVRCDVCIQLAPYDTPRFGDSPVRRCVAHGFEVRILRAGYVVRDVR